MPFYRFRIHGTGNIRNGIVGFYTTRWCWAPDQEGAAAKALRIVRKDVERRRMGTLSSLKVEKGQRISVFEIPKAPNRGYTFYDTGGESEARAIEEEASPSP
jgi:hypothetical protein